MAHEQFGGVPLDLGWGRAAAVALATSGRVMKIDWSFIFVLACVCVVNFGYGVRVDRGWCFGDMVRRWRK